MLVVRCQALPSQKLLSSLGRACCPIERHTNPSGRVWMLCSDWLLSGPKIEIEKIGIKLIAYLCRLLNSDTCYKVILRYGGLDNLKYTRNFGDPFATSGQAFSVFFR
jgi:hypothetical protein